MLGLSMCYSRVKRKIHRIVSKREERLEIVFGFIGHFNALPLTL